MAYTVKQLAKLSGISVRTVHFYDEIGLLKPAYYGENGYRYYEEEQLLMLQQILYYRELGFQLNDIQRILSSDDFDKIQALNSHKHILKKNLDLTNGLIKTIDKTIEHLMGNTKMLHEELYQGFDAETQKEYVNYLINSGSVSSEEIEKSREKIEHWQQKDWDRMNRGCDFLHKALVAAIQNGLEPASPEVQSLVRKHYEWITSFWIPTKTSYINLSQLYTDHPHFRKFYDRYHPQLVGFLTEAMKVFAEKELS